MNVIVNQLRLEKRGCDVIFQIANEKFVAHSTVLSAELNYFRRIFREDATEEKNIIALDPEQVDWNIFEALLEYIYTSKIVFTPSNVEPFFKAAVFFQFEKLMHKGENYMKANINIDNFTLFTNMAIKYSLKSLEDDCGEFLKDCSLTKVGREQLLPILSYEHLQLLFEAMRSLSLHEDIFHYCIEWILHEKFDRGEKLPELLKSIPLGSLSSEFLAEAVAKNPMVVDNDKCLKLLIELTFPRKPQPITLYVIGGKNESETSSVSKFDLTTNKWLPSTEMPFKRTHFGCAVIGQKIYICGGHDGKRKISDFTVLDTANDEWESLKPMQFRRESCGVAELNGFIYVAGGYDGHKRLSVVERYSIHTGEWEEIAPMNSERLGLELVQLNGYLYAIGGDNGDSYSETTERYDSNKCEWSLMEGKMKNNFSCFGSAVLNDRIYVVGRANFEVYHPREDRWEEMPSPNNCGLGKRLAAIDGKLYSIGGYGTEKALKTVEIYDFDKQVWISGEDMNTERGFHCVAVVNDQFLFWPQNQPDQCTMENLSIESAGKDDNNSGLTECGLL